MEDKLIGGCITLVFGFIIWLAKEYHLAKKQNKKWNDNMVNLLDVKFDSLIHALSVLPDGLGQTIQKEYRAKYQELISSEDFLEPERKNRL